MLEETGRVVQVSGDTAWVETERASTCAGCVAKSGCGTAVLSRVMGVRRNRVRALNPVHACAGDRVVIGLQEDALVRGSLAMYLIPLMGLLAGAILGQSTGGTESLSILFAALGFGGGLAWLRWFGRRIRADQQYQAMVLRRVSE
ncbi:MAG: SoxR reducing system RseC family protein [Gammaproteobacteria bacterium]